MTTDLESTADFNRWRRTSPFAIVFFIRGTIAEIRFYGQLLATVGLAFLIVRARDLAGELIPAAILIIILVAVLRYWFFRFRITEDRILIRQGIFKKTDLDLPLDRVQAVNVERSLTDRVLGLVTVSVDTAGSGAVEAVIPSVKGGVRRPDSYAGHRRSPGGTCERRERGLSRASRQSTPRARG